MKKRFLITSLAATIFMAQCTPKAGKAISETPAATTIMTREEANSKFTADQLEAGKVLFTGNCAKCHGIKPPESRTPEQWDKVLKRMIPKAKLSEEEGKLVKAYIIAHSKQG